MHVWGVGKMYTSRLLEKTTANRRQAAATITKDETKTMGTPTSSTVQYAKMYFQCIETSKKCHSPKMLYVRDFIRKKRLLDSACSYDCQSTKERTRPLITSEDCQKWWRSLNWICGKQKMNMWQAKNEYMASKKWYVVSNQWIRYVPVCDKPNISLPTGLNK